RASSNRSPPWAGNARLSASSGRWTAFLGRSTTALNNRRASADEKGMATTAAQTRSTQTAARGEGRGRVLAAAFDEAERQPALQEGREAALAQVTRGAPPHEVAAVVETDVGLTCAVIRAAGQLQGGGRIGSVTDATERLGPGAAEAILRSAPAYDIFNGDGRL